MEKGNDGEGPPPVVLFPVRESPHTYLLKIDALGRRYALALLHCTAVDFWAEALGRSLRRLQKKQGNNCTPPSELLFGGRPSSLGVAAMPPSIEGGAGRAGEAGAAAPPIAGLVSREPVTKTKTPFEEYVAR